MPTGQVLRWHCRAMTHPIARRDAVPKPNSSAPRMAARTISRANFRPPSTRRERRERRPARTRVSCVSRKPISQGRPVFLMDVSGEEPVPALCPLMVMTSAPALATPAAMMPTPAPETSFTPMRARIHGAQVMDQLREVFDAVNVVVRRRRNERSAWRGVADARDVFAAFFGGQLAAPPGLGALGPFVFACFRGAETILGDAKPARVDLREPEC